MRRFQSGEANTTQVHGNGRRVVITGIGTICGIGRDVTEFWSSVCECRPGIRPIETADTANVAFKNGCEVREYREEEHFPNNKSLYLERFAQFAVLAARDAVKDAGLELAPRAAERTAVITGSGIGGQRTLDEAYQQLYLKGSRIPSPLTMPRSMDNAATSQISMDLGVTGPAFTAAAACASANFAIAQAAAMIRSGLVDAAISGGSDAPFTYGFLKAWEALRLVAPDTCRPFSRDRRGIIIGEGAGMLVLEERERALVRGARVYAELAGAGMSSDAHHITQPTVEGPARAMRAALADAGIAGESVGYINAHGSGTTTNDVNETAAIKQVFGAHADALCVSSTKSLHGHAMGASGALEAIATLLALHHGVIPPTANFTERDPQCDLDVVPNEARELRVEHALSNSFGFGGLNAVLVFSRV